MKPQTGALLEAHGKAVFDLMGLTCINARKQVPLVEIRPGRSHSKGEHTEFDYLIPLNDTCLIGEITSLHSESDVRRKFQRFRRNFDVIADAKMNEEKWKVLGVPDDHLSLFRRITLYQGFFITTELEKYDVEISSVGNIICFFKDEWELLEEYAKAIGVYARHHFFDLFGGILPHPRKKLMARAIQTEDKLVVSGEGGLANLFTFEADPYELLPLSRVYRRDMLPDLSPRAEGKYQRALVIDKLQKIRQNVLVNKDFMFPSSILVVLSSDCSYDLDKEILEIPETYGSVDVIDGQHRLFSYADDKVRAIHEGRGKIIVTGIKFQDADHRATLKYSAKTFIEINTNQTPVPRLHLDSIRYPILGETNGRAIAAQIILRSNEDKGALYGFFDTSQTTKGLVQTTTIINKLKSITNPELLSKVKTKTRGAALLKKRGYENLFGAKVEDLESPEVFIEKGKACFEHYFNEVKSAFYYDWPKRGENNQSALKYAKVIAGFVMLLGRFISEGHDWGLVKSDLTAIHSNVMKLRGMKTYNKVLFSTSHSKLPDASAKEGEDFLFLNLNRTSHTSIQAVRKKSVKKK